ncbi:MAG: energy transducer TonB [Bacteroides sp.]|nr:energy transducer TonB [Bacteroides sp.]
MKKTTHLGALLALLLAAFTFSGAYGQQATMVGFFRPGDRQVSEAYLMDFVDIRPQFPGGEAALLQYINKERVYPREAYEAGVSGRVLVGFVIDVDGSVSNVSVQRASDPRLECEACRIVSVMPRWEAGRVGTRKVPVFYVLAIPFRL